MKITIPNWLVPKKKKKKHPEKTDTEFLGFDFPWHKLVKFTSLLVPLAIVVLIWDSLKGTLPLLTNITNTTVTTGVIGGFPFVSGFITLIIIITIFNYIRKVF